MRDLFNQLIQRMETGKDSVLVTIIASNGAVPAGPSSRMLVGHCGRICGTVGGGNVEYECERIAKEVLDTGVSFVKNFCLNPNPIEDLGMVCGGEIDVWFHYIPHHDIDILNSLQQMEDCWKQGETFWSVSNVAQGMISGYGSVRKAFGPDVPDNICDKLRNKSRMQNGYFCQQMLASGKVYIFGGGHVAQALVPVLEKLRFRCVVIEDREEYVQRDQYTPQTELYCLPIDGMDELMSMITPDDMICVMTRGHVNDFAVQMQALKTPAKYIGVIGSKNKHKFVRDKALAAGCTEQDLSRMVAPIGLDISSDTVEEIAISIAAQLIMVRANRPRPDWDK